MRAHAIVEQQVRDGHIGDVGLNVVASGCGNLNRHCVEQPENDGDVVRRETPEDILFTSHFSETQSVGVDVVDDAEIAIAHHLD